MKYYNIMGYKNYVGRKAYQQAKSEGKSQKFNSATIVESRMSALLLPI